MATHRMATDRAAICHGKVCLHDLWQFLDDEVVHVVVLLVLLCRGIQIETCANPEIVSMWILIWHTVTPWRGVGHNNHELVVACCLESPSFLREVLVRASESREPIHDRQFLEL